jgi:hypothetical protein
MKIIGFLTDYSVVDSIIDHLKLTFFAERPPPAQIAYQEILKVARASPNIPHDSLFRWARRSG